jgi:DnaJ-class molecular chaperone
MLKEKQTISLSEMRNKVLHGLPLTAIESRYAVTGDTRWNQRKRCTNCDGEGFIDENPSLSYLKRCSECEGKGCYYVDVKLKVVT